MTDSLIATRARPEARPLPAYNAGLSNEAVRARYRFFSYGDSSLLIPDPAA